MLIFHGHGVDICGIDPYGMAVDPVNFRSKMTDRIQESIDIADIREPLIVTSPTSGFPPFIMYCSITHLYLYI